MARADRVLFVIDAVADPSGRGFREERARLPADVPVTLVFNKCDLAVGLPVADTLTGPAGDHAVGPGGHRARGAAGPPEAVHGLPDGGGGHGECARGATWRRCARAPRTPRRPRASSPRARAGELVAEELRAAQQALSEITGEFTTEDLLGRIFARFCIGK